MNLKIKNNNEVYEVVDSSWFQQYTETISDADDNGDIYGFLLDTVKGTDIEEEYKKWLEENFVDYYFEVVKEKNDDHYYAVASSDTRFFYAIEIENPFN